jgi:hypothetical protein
MKINEMQLYSALNEFIDREIMPLGANMDLTKQFLYGIKIGVVKHRIQGLTKSYLNKPEIKMLGLIDENGVIDIEPIYQSAMDMMNKMQKVEIGGITFKENDLQNLYGIIQKYAN